MVVEMRMKNRYEQVQVIGQAEMEGRVEHIREIMGGLNMFLVLDGTWEGYSHWLTGSRAVETVIVFPEGEITAVYARDMGGIPYEDAEYGHIRYVKELKMEDLEGPLRGKKNICIGLVQPEAMTRRMRRMLEECFGKVEFVDCTQKVDVMKAVKSPQELKWIREANRIHEQIFYALPSIIKPGKTIREINCEVRYLGEKLGGGG